MKSIKLNEAMQGNNSDKCSTLEYSFGDKDIDLGVAVITGRYPDKGYCVNLECKELVYVLEGSGTLYFADKEIEFNEGDSILIDKNEKYYWDATYAKVSMACTPAWFKEQHKEVD